MDATLINGASSNTHTHTTKVSELVKSVSQLISLSVMCAAGRDHNAQGTAVQCNTTADSTIYNSGNDAAAAAAAATAVKKKAKIEYIFL